MRLVHIITIVFADSHKIHHSSFLFCRSAALLPLSPLRTVRATFTAYSSDNSKFNSHKIKSAHNHLVMTCFRQSFLYARWRALLSFRLSKYSSHNGSNGLASHFIFMCRLIGISASLCSVNLSFIPPHTYSKPKIQFLPPSWIKYFFLIHSLDLLVCLRYDHLFSWFIKIWSHRQNTSFDTTWL